MKELYVLYTLFSNNKLLLSSNKFLILNTYLTVNYTFFKKIKKVFNYKYVLFIYVFVSLLYFFKSFDVLFLVKKHKHNLLFLYKQRLFSVSNNSKLLTRFENFWEKLKGLKRPKTAHNYITFYLEEYEKKLNIYENLGFLKKCTKYVIGSINTNSTIKNIVNINNPLLVSPKCSSSSINKGIQITDLSFFEFQFLRKNKVYNKGRYSRCRQNYRTGVYMCMYLSVVSIFGLYYWFYKFSFNFTYLWWVFILFVGSFFLPKLFKYRLYEPNMFLVKIFDFFKWLFLIIKSFFI